MLTLRGRHYRNGELCDLDLADGLIRQVGPASPETAALGGAEYWVTPGLIDIQVNGYEGHDLTSGDTTPEDVSAIAAGLANAGVTAFCPTVTTNSFEAMTAGLRAIARACDTDARARQRVVKIHLEGPYLSPLDGPRGAHPLPHVRAPDWDEFLRFQEAAGGRIGLVTLAPELPGALEFIARARRAGLRVAIGHHAANREQILAAVAAGATLSTHLGNGSHSLLPRHPNYIWEQLADDELAASLIVDGHHLPPAVVKTFFRAKGCDRVILISDVVSAGGLPPGKYRLMGRDVEKGVDGSVRLSGTPYLAGSAVRLCDSLSLVMQFAGANLGEAVQMAAANPARLMGVDEDRGRLVAGARADVLLFKQRADRYDLACTIAGGEVCYENL